jgi:hypothetical protein
MPLTEEVVADQVTVLDDGQIQVREITRVYKDGELLAVSKPHRYVLKPGDTPKAQHQQLKKISDVIHTPANIAAFRAAEQARVNRSA